ncbi:MAG: ABC-type lipoprotein export system ATPase subunit [Kiritimatiellia bacterium]|jgi:ABC-type lipoprotein export system ATPase subunit
MRKPTIHLTDCSLQFGSSVRFDIPDLELLAGDRIGVTGPSGCGKSTLLNLLSGMLKPTAGSVWACGHQLEKLSPARLDAFRGKHVGFIYQTFNLLDTFTALENVMIGMRFGRKIPHRERRDRAKALLDRVGLCHRTNARPGQLSVGERQRVAIARAIANKPELLLADEPTGALDPATAQVIFELIMELCEEEACTLVFVTHDLELADRLPVQLDARGFIQHQGLA